MTRLGRGLAAIIPQSVRELEMPAAAAADREILRRIPLDQIRPNPEQPRLTFHGAALEQLAESIREHGVITPLLVREDDQGRGYILIAGERRLRASGLAGMEDVPCWVRDSMSDEEQLLLALVENIQREDLDSIETAESYRRLVETFGLTQAQVAERVGKDRATVANAIRLLKLPTFAIECLRAGEISAGHGKALLALPDDATLQRVLKQVMEEGLSVRATEKLVSRIVRPKGRKPSNAVTVAMQRFADRLTRSLGSRVKIERRARSQKGRIVIEYTSKEELQRLVDSLGAI